MAQANEAARRLGIAHPIIQGPFGGGLSSARLAAAVSNLGGLGSFGAHYMAADDVARITREIKAQTDRPFAINLWVSDHDPGGTAMSQAEFDRAYKIFEPYFRELGVAKPDIPNRFYTPFEEQVEALLAAGPPVFSFIFGVPDRKIIAECRRRGIATIGTASSVAEALAIEEAGADLIVATGSEAGGHRPAFLARAEDGLMGTFALTQLVSDRVRAPVISAGGIADGRGVRAAMALGASAAQVGTAFLACEESGTSEEHRKVLFADHTQRTVLTRTFTGRLARGVPNRWTNELTPRQAELPPFPIQSWFAARLRPAAVKAGITDFVSLWSGQIAPNLKHRTVPALMAALVAETAATH